MCVQRLLMLALTGWLLFPLKTPADDGGSVPITIESALSQRLINPDLPQSEIEAYTESHILPMPEVTTVGAWETYAKQVREDVLKKVVFRGEAATWRTLPTKVEWQGEIEGGPGYRIRKLRYEVVPGMWTAGLLYEPDNLSGKVPVVMNVNGHDRADGMAADYKQMRCINQAKRGMIALNLEWLGMGQLATPGFSHYSMNQMNLCGTSGLAPFYLAMSRGLDILLQHENADPAKVAVAGLSGGGWQTIFISSLDTRVALCNPVAGYSSFKTRARYQSDLGDSEQTPCDLASVTDYAQLTAMLAPRPALLTNNAEDNCCFKAEHALPPLLEAAQPIYKLYNKPTNLRYHINHTPGTHNFLIDNRQHLYAMLEEFFLNNVDNEAAKEISSEDELKSKDQLRVDLPENNLDFNSLALQLADALTQSRPANAAELPAWQKQQRPKLHDVVKLKEYHTLAIQQSQQNGENLSASFWWLRFGGDWTVPAVELSAPGSESKKLAIVVADNGRSSLTEEAQQLLDDGYRVLAIDPFYFGESKIPKRDFLYAILVSSLGDRPIGIQAGQLLAAATWARKEFGCEHVKLVASGPRTSLISLVAAASSTQFNTVQLRGSLGSLRELLEQNKGMNSVPESLCFGLLEQFDIPELMLLAGPDHVQFADASDRCRAELQPVVKAFPKLSTDLFLQTTNAADESGDE